jgi:superfamily II DNA or RNA helicase/transcriptional regulator with XRE-family HTH domain
MNKAYNDITPDQWQNALRKTILINGEPDEALYRRTIEIFTAPGCIAEECFEYGVLPPKVHVYAGNNLPAGVEEQDADGKTLNIAIGNQDNDEIKKRLMAAYEYSTNYLEDIQTTNAFGQSLEVSEGTLNEFDRHQYGDLNGHSKKSTPAFNHAMNRSRGEYDPTEHTDRSHWRKNTWGQLLDWQQAYKEHLELKEKHPDQPTLWEFYQQRMFSDEILKKFSGSGDVTKYDGTEIKDFPFWKDWLRGLRVMNGLGTIEMTARFFSAPSLGNSGWSNLENAVGHSLSPRKTQNFLHNNPFHLPEIEVDGHKMVDPEYAAKFCAMMGRGEVIYAEPIRRHFLKRVKAAAQDYSSGKAAIDELPTIEDLVQALAGSKSVLTADREIGGQILLAKNLDTIRDKLILDGEDYTPYFEAMPHRSPITDKKMASSGLSKEAAFDKASGTAKNIGEFLRIYRESGGGTLQDVGDQLHLTRESIRQYEIKPVLPSGTVKKILDKANPYQFPVDANGEIRADIKQRFNELNISPDKPALGKPMAKLGEEEAFHLAADKATTTADFLKIYRQATGQTIKDVSIKMRASQMQIEKSEIRQRQPEIWMRRVLSQTNSYNLPVDSQGHVRGDVISKIRALNSPGQNMRLAAKTKETESNLPTNEEVQAAVQKGLIDVKGTEGVLLDAVLLNSDKTSILREQIDIAIQALESVENIRDERGFWRSLVDVRKKQDYEKYGNRKREAEWKRLDKFLASKGVPLYPEKTLAETLGGEVDKSQSVTEAKLAREISSDHTGKKHTNYLNIINPISDFNASLLARTQKDYVFPALSNDNIPNGNVSHVSLESDMPPYFSSYAYDFLEAREDTNLGRDDLAQKILEKSKTNAAWMLPAEEASLLTKDKGKFISAVEAGVIVPSENFKKVAEVVFNPSLEPALPEITAPIESVSRISAPEAIIPILETQRRMPGIFLDRVQARRLALLHANSNNPPAAGATALLAAKLDEILRHKDDRGVAMYGSTEEPLRVSQQETLEKLSAHLKANHHTGYAVLPGGCGKTRIGIVAVDAAQKAHIRSLFIVPSIMAADNVYKKLKESRPDLKAGRIYETHAEHGGDVTIITYQSLINEFYRSLLAKEKGLSYPLNLNQYGLIVADEAHSYLTNIAKNILDNSNAIKFALTATDRYYEGKEVANRFPGLINRVLLDTAVQRKEILQPKHRFIKTDVKMNLEGLEHLQTGDEAASTEFEQRVNTRPWNKVFAEVWRDETDSETNHRIFGDKTFVHCAGIQHAKDMADQFDRELMPLLKKSEYRQLLQSKGIDPDKVKHIAVHISHETSVEERRHLMDMYNRREILVLTSAKMLAESVDDPGTSVIINASPTFSAVRASQRGYRGSRTHNGKKHWFVYEALPQDWEKMELTPVMFAETISEQGVDGAKVRADIYLDSPEKIGGQGGPASNPHYTIAWKVTDIEAILAELKRKRANESLPSKDAPNLPLDRNTWLSGKILYQSLGITLSGEVSRLNKYLTRLLQDPDKIIKLPDGETVSVSASIGKYQDSGAVALFVDPILVDYLRQKLQQHEEKTEGWMTRGEYAKHLGIAPNHSGFNHLWSQIESLRASAAEDPIMVDNHVVHCGKRKLRNWTNFCVHVDEAPWFKDKLNIAENKTEEWKSKTEYAKDVLGIRLTNKQFNDLWDRIETQYKENPDKSIVVNGYTISCDHKKSMAIQPFCINISDKEWFKDQLGLTEEKTKEWKTKVEFVKLLGIASDHAAFNALWDSIKKGQEKAPGYPVEIDGHAVACGNKRSRGVHFCINQSETGWFKQTLKLGSQTKTTEWKNKTEFARLIHAGIMTPHFDKLWRRIELAHSDDPAQVPLIDGHAVKCVLAKAGPKTPFCLHESEADWFREQMDNNRNEDVDRKWGKKIGSGRNQEPTYRS